MLTSTQKRLHREAASDAVVHVRKRVKAIAHQLTSAGVCDEVAVEITCRNLDYMGRSCGRKAAGIHAPTFRVRDHKNRQRVRVEHTLHTHAHNVDLQRTYTHKSAPYRKGGYMYERASRVGKRRMRDAVRMADHICSKGEIPAALEFLLGSR